MLYAGLYLRNEKWLVIFVKWQHNFGKVIRNCESLIATYLYFCTIYISKKCLLAITFEKWFANQLKMIRNYLRFTLAKWFAFYDTTPPIPSPGYTSSIFFNAHAIIQSRSDCNYNTIWPYNLTRFQYLPCV